MMCLVLLGGVWEPIVKWITHMFTIFTPFFTLGPGSTTLYSLHALSQSPIFSTASTAVYSGCIPLQLYSTSTPPSQNVGHSPVLGEGGLQEQAVGGKKEFMSRGRVRRGKVPHY